MKKLTFKQWYAIFVLLVAVVYGGMYLIENRYKTIGEYPFDSWTGKIVPLEKMLPDE